MLWNILVAFSAAVFSSMGVGGGAILLLYLTAFSGMEQLKAQEMCIRDRLYRAATNKEIIQGTAYFFISPPILSVSKNVLDFVSISKLLL